MKPRLQLLFICCLFSPLPKNLQAQIKLDTVSIYKNRCGVRFGVYMREWFFENGSYSYFTFRMTHQDSLILETPSARYYRVFNRRGNLQIEGATDMDGTMVDTIRYYYGSGRPKKIAILKSEIPVEGSKNEDTLSFDVPEKCGTWKVYRRNGSLKREYDYQLKTNISDSTAYDYTRTTRKYKRNGKLKSEKFSLLWTF